MYSVYIYIQPIYIQAGSTYSVYIYIYSLYVYRLALCIWCIYIYTAYMHTGWLYVFGSQAWASLVAQMVKKNLPAMWETWVQSLHWEDLLEKGMATHSSIVAWRIPGTEEPGRLQSMGSQRVGHNRATNFGEFRVKKMIVHSKHDAI